MTAKVPLGTTPNFRPEDTLYPLSDQNDKVVTLSKIMDLGAGRDFLFYIGSYPPLNFAPPPPSSVLFVLVG